MPPSRSGIADYSAALAATLGRITDLHVIGGPGSFDPRAHDITVYQVGNNVHHDFVYEAALAHSGVVVLHEANLHHLLAEMTIKGGNWDRYLREVAYDGGPSAAVYARRVRALETGPDYDGVPMLRRLLENSRGVIVHNRATERSVRSAGFAGPVGRIPHGAWLAQPRRMEYRHKLGLTESAPLAGIFGFLKPYKRVAESLRAFRRLLRVVPDAKMILAGEPHPDLPLRSLIESLDLRASVRTLGFVAAEDLPGYLSACDVILNLRYPTVGETSGTLLRALGLGCAVIVSDVGSFSELPDEICLKTPVDHSEEDVLFEYLVLLLSRPELARALGDRALEWARRECNWDLVARRYLSFLECVASGGPWLPPEEPEPAPPPEEPATAVAPEYLSGWSEDANARTYLDRHITRLVKTLEITPPGTADDHVLEMGAYLQITPALRTRLGYGHVRGCYLGIAGRVETKTVRSDDGEEFSCEIDHFDAERDVFPYAEGSFATVLCCELIEHLAADPMHLMCEINRILRPGGHLVLTTPNVASMRSIAAILEGYHPGFFPSYVKPRPGSEPQDPRHTREYTPREIARLLVDSGFEVVRLETGPFREAAKPELGWVEHLLNRYRLPKDLRADGIYTVGRKSGPVRNRYPDWLYSGGDA